MASSIYNPRVKKSLVSMTAVKLAKAAHKAVAC